MDHIPNPIAIDANMSHRLRWKKLFSCIRSFIDIAVKEAKLAIATDKRMIEKEYSPTTIRYDSIEG